VVRREIVLEAPREEVWEAVTDPEWNRRYGYHCPGEYELRAGGAYRALASKEMQEHGAPEVIIEGEVLECDPPRKLVQTWQALWDPQLAAESTRLIWEIEGGPGGITTLTVTHVLEGAPKTAEQVSGSRPDAGGGWAWILSDLKTLLETGTTLGG
jgi:uncharacterized protein YndB with AHSA1/START domain